MVAFAKRMTAGGVPLIRHLLRKCHRPPGRGKVSAPPLKSFCVAATEIPVSGATSRHPPAQAAKKLRIGPQPFPVPPAESPVDGAGAPWGRKDGPPDSYLEPLNPFGSPFFFGFQKPFFFQQGSETGFDRPLKDHLTSPHPSWRLAMTGALQNEAIKMSEVWSPKRVSKPRSLLYS